MLDALEAIALLLGFGSIGRYHAAILSERYQGLAIVDVNPEARNSASEAYPEAVVRGSLDDVDSLGWDWSRTVAVAATWAPGRVGDIESLASMGVRHILCEKPLANSVAAAHHVVDHAESHGVTLGVHMQYRYNDVPAALEHLAAEHGFGSPELIIVHGGATGLVTNGIHYLDLMMAIYDEEPVFVTSSAKGEPIEPRSPEFRFFGGTAVWGFPSGREAVLVLSNRSSVAERLEIYYRDALVRLSRFFDAEVLRRPAEEVAKFAAVTRLGEPSEVLYRGPLPGFVGDTAPTLRVLGEIEAGQVERLPPRLAARVVGACIGGLAAGRDGRSVDLPIDPASELGREEWPVT